MNQKTERKLRQVLKQIQQDVFFSTVIPKFNDWVTEDRLTSEMKRLKSKTNQASVVDVFVNLLKDSTITDEAAQEQIWTFMLLGVAANASKKKWTSYSLKGVQPLTKPSEDLQTDINHFLLQNDVHAIVKCRFWETMQWILIVCKKLVKNKLRTSPPVFIGHFQETPYIFLNNRGCPPEVLQSVAEGLGFSGYKFSNLDGNDLHSMLKHLEQKGARTGPIQTTLSCDSVKVIPNGLDFSQHENRREIISELMGPEPPKLSNYVVLAKNLSWKGKLDLTARQAKTFDCKIEFKTNDTVEMLKDMAECGVLRVPPPSYVVNLLSTGRNNIKLRIQGAAAATDTETQTDA